MCACFVFSCLLVAVVLQVAHADIYMHNPRGSNNRNRERNENRNNAQRLFDSQNNDKGGYAWAPPMSFYQGSVLTIEWTNQHACGSNPNVYCEVILQYACDEDFACGDGMYPPSLQNPTNPAAANNSCSSTLRDGDYDPTPNLAGMSPGTDTKDKVTAAGQNTALTNTIAKATKDVKYYGRHESYEYFNVCNERSRNKGLFVADRQLNTGRGARATRQNPDGTTNGFECPEERDYYPYWHPSPWSDIAVLTSDVERCEYYRKESQNVKARSYCKMAPKTGFPIGSIPNQKAACVTAGGVWVEVPAWNIAPPDCVEAPHSRDNHLGNAAGIDFAAHYNWTLPNRASSQCVLRMRYNISNYNYDSWGSTSEPDPLPIFDDKAKQVALTCHAGLDPGTGDAGETVGGADSLNPTKDSPCFANATIARGPLFNRPYVTPWGLSQSTPPLGLAINTNQNGRTFQDRSYVFKIKQRLDGMTGGTIYNLNVRGKRGNIVQAYPAVEYDFVPNRLHATVGDAVHLQWTGSDFNVPRDPNNGEGNRVSDRHNIVETLNPNVNFPLPASKMTFLGLSAADIKKLAYLNQDQILKARLPDLCINIGPDALQPDAQTQSFCATPADLLNGCDVSYNRTNANGNDNTNEQRSLRNCGKLNAGDAYFDGGVHTLSTTGTWSYMNTRGNNFSNRSQKGTIVVDPAEGLSAVAKAMIALSSAAFVGLAYAAMIFYARRNPESKVASWINSSATWVSSRNWCKRCKRSRRLSHSEKRVPMNDRPNQSLAPPNTASRAPPPAYSGPQPPFPSAPAAPPPYRQ